MSPETSRAAAHKMRFAKFTRITWTLGVMVCLCPSIVMAETRAIDATRSTVTVHVFKSGLFSGFAHNHEISAPIAEGTVDALQQQVWLRVDARNMRVIDPEASESTRAQVQKKMQGPDVLDSERFAQISFESTGVQLLGNDHWSVHGNLTLHGRTKPVTVDVTMAAGHYKGTAALKQSHFGITPIRLAGGAVKVKDEVKIDFDIVLVD